MYRANVRKPLLANFASKSPATLLLSSLIASACFAGGAENKNSLDLQLSNYYQDRRPSDATATYTEKQTKGSDRTIKTEKKQKAWGQGLEINFDSATYGSETSGIGLNFSLYGGLKLLGDNDLYGTSVLKEDTAHFDAKAGRYLSEQGSYAKLGQLYIKGFSGQGKERLSGKLGWHQIDRTLARTDERLTPTTFQGVSLDAEVGRTTLYGSWYNKVSRHNHDKMENLTSSKPGKEGRLSKNTRIDYVYTVGGNYQHESGMGTELAYAESESYLKLYHANLHYTFDLGNDSSLFVEGQYYKGKGNGDKWQDNKTTYGGFDSEANLYNLNATLSVDMLDLKASYSQVDAKKKNGLGIFDYHLAYEAGTDYDLPGFATSRLISDFNHNGEKVWQAGASYAFDRVGVPGLTLGYTFTSGTDIKADSKTYTGKYKESEHNVEIGYAFQQPQLKGLKVTVQYAKHNADREISRIKNENSGRTAYSDRGMTDFRLFVDYTVSVF